MTTYFTQNNPEQLDLFNDPEPMGELFDDEDSYWINDGSDEAEALASAGFGTDEDYGYFGDDDGYCD